ncbi:bcl-2-modifying factor isoform X2 [Tupaia chinensis]|uniref:bcl-2-modifying factor isoform X2 n=1 Tax=Tupaia chinensis TaxID=246437 RepID=UPI000FFC332D|nr:bcl-2-modifying factor isoform X2 [Tupaia chinensis]
MPRAGVFWKQYRAVRSGLFSRPPVPAADAAPARASCLPPQPGEMEPPQCVEELEDDVFQPEDGEPGTQPGSVLSADLFAQSQLDCPLSRLQLFPLTHCCGPGLRPTSQEDKATQTLSPASPSQGVMLPCGVTEEPQRLFYGNAGYRLPLPASFPAGLALGEQPPEGQWQHRAEVQIARKLQCIADQFHRLHVQQVAPAEPKSRMVADPPLPAQPCFEWRREQERGRSQVRLACPLHMRPQEHDDLEQEGHQGGLTLCLVKLFFIVVLCFHFLSFSLCVHMTYPSGIFCPCSRT